MWRTVSAVDFFQSEKENGYKITGKGDLFSGGFYYESGINNIPFLRAEITGKGEQYYRWEA